MSAPEPADSSSAPSETSPVAVPPVAEDAGLPPDEPLTPELLEDEAIRGDFMLRWAVILLALLLGFTEIGETQTLVHVKTGQYLLSHGILPPRTDVFSSTATDRPWVNLSWLFDIALGGAYAAAGPIGLTVLKALLAGVTFWLVVHSGVKGISSWWGSICAAMALLVVHVQFGALPDLATLLSLALVFWMLRRWIDGTQRTLWAVPVVFAVWANLDPRMFVGLGALLLFALGESVGNWLGRSSLEKDEQRRHLWAVAAASIVAAMANPFGWHSLLAPVVQYRVEYPALRDYYASPSNFHELQYWPMHAKAVWRLLNHATVTAPVLGAAALIAIGLNHRRFAWSHVLLVVGAVALGMGAVRDLPPAAIVLITIATWNAQAWYRETFRQAYSTETAEVLFSRGGRAVTVLALAAFAFLAVSGRLLMPNGVRAGLGWQPALQTSIDGLRDELKDSYDDRPFNFLLQQGDTFIWLDQKPFVDHRVAIYKRSGEDDLLAVHDRTRRALRAKRRDDPVSGNRRLWQKTFDDFRITHAVPRLAGSSPDYITTRDLLTNPLFQLVDIGSSSAVFYRLDKPSDYRKDESSPTLKEYLDSHRVNFLAEAFQTPPKETKAPPVRDWPAVSGAYESVLLRARPTLPASIQEAHHYHMLIQQAAGGQLGMPTEVAAAFSYLVIRKANDGLIQNPNSASGYRMLGSAYDFLNLIEGQILGSRTQSSLEMRRFYQTVATYGQSLLLEPDQPALHLRLIDLYAGYGKPDLALLHLERLEESIAKARQREPDNDDLELPSKYGELRKELKKALDAAVKAVEERKSDKKQPQKPSSLELANIARQHGCTNYALEILDADPAAVQTNPLGMILKGTMLIEAGRPWEASPFFEQAELFFGKSNDGGPWRTAASLVRLAQGDLAHSNELLKAELANIDFQQFAQVALTLPLVASPRRWPISQTESAVGYLFQYPLQSAELRLQVAVSHLEAGRQKEAVDALHELLAHSPETPYRPLVRFYLRQASGEVIDLQPPSDWIPITKDLFAPEPE